MPASVDRAQQWWEEQRGRFGTKVRQDTEAGCGVLLEGDPRVSGPSTS